MNHPDAEVTQTYPTQADLEAELAALAEPVEDKLGAKAAQYVALKELKDRVSREAANAYNELMAALLEQGCDSVGTGTHKVSVTRKTNVRIREGTGPDDHLANMEAARAWVQRYNQQTTPITQAVLKQTLEAMLVLEGADTPLPGFLEEADIETLSVRKAK